MSPVDAERWICAVHETGHAIVASTLGFTVRRLVLHRPGSPAFEAGEGGRCEIVDQLEEFESRPLESIAYILGGAAAEKLVFGRTSSRDARDRKQAAALVRALNLEPSSAGVAEMVSLGESVAYARLQDGINAAWTLRGARPLMIQGELTGFELHQCHPRGAR